MIYRISMLLPALGAFLLVAGCSSLREAQPPLTDAAVPAASYPAGISIQSVRVAAGGLMIDLRYRVEDRERAKLLLDRKTALTLTDQATGRVLAVPNTPKVGKLRQVPADEESSRIYWIFFNNAGGVVRPGSKVALSIGDLRINDLVVQ